MNRQRGDDAVRALIDVPEKHGGLELPMVEQVAIWEQLGRTTNALSWCFPEPQEWMFDACNQAQTSHTNHQKAVALVLLRHNVMSYSYLYVI